MGFIKPVMPRSMHPYPVFMDDSTKIMVVGTIPPRRFCKPKLEDKNFQLDSNDIEFYYGSKDNFFWTYLSQINPTIDLKTEESRKVFLRSMNIGMIDIIKACRRINNGSSDDALCDIEINEDLKALGENVETLIYTSEYVYNLVNWSVADKGYHEKKEGKVLINSRSYNFHILPSPSPRAKKKNSEILSSYEQFFKAKK